MNVTRPLVASAALAALSACGGGGGASPAPPMTVRTPAPGPAAASSSRAIITVTIPAPDPAHLQTASARTPRYVSASSQNVRIALTAVGPIAVSNPTYQTFSTSGCAVNADGSKSCSFPFGTVPSAIDTFTILTDGTVAAAGAPNATPQDYPLSAGTAQGNIPPNATGTVSGTLAMVVAAAQVSAQYILGSAPLPITVVPADAGGNRFGFDAATNTWLGGGAYANPIVISDSDQSGSTVLRVNDGTYASTVTSTNANDTIQFLSIAQNSMTVTLTATPAAFVPAAPFGGIGGLATVPVTSGSIQITCDPNGCRAPGTASISINSGQARVPLPH